MRPLALFTLAALFAAPVLAEASLVLRPPPRDPLIDALQVAVVGATVLPMAGRAPMEQSTVLFTGGVITAVGQDLPVPPNAVVVDGKGKVLTPGLFQVGSQVGLFALGQEDAHDDRRLQGALVPAFQPVVAFNPLSPHIPVEREEGVLSVLLAPGSQALLAGQGSVVELGGRLQGDVVGGPVSMWGTYGPTSKGALGGTRAGLLLALQQTIDDARFYEKNRAAFDRAQSRPLGLSPTHLEAVLPLLQKNGGNGRAARGVVVADTRPWLILHAHRATDILALVAFCKREGLRLLLDGAAESHLVADVLRDAGVPVLVRPSEAGSVSLDGLHARDDLATVLHAAGVQVVLGAWDTEMGTTRLRQEAGLAVRAGLPREVALDAITSTPAELFAPLGVGGHKLGVIEPGARASLVLWSGDPLEVRSVTTHLWVGGRFVHEPSRQRQLAAKYRRPQTAPPSTATPKTP
jgi:imidazolonepropionase-like amidohydrolase